MSGRLLLGLVVGLGPVVAACGDGGRSAATAAISSAQSAFDAIRNDAVIYVPEETREIEAVLSEARRLADRREYEQALSEATRATPRIGALAESVAARKAALAASWTQLNGELPKALQAVQGRVATLSNARRLPRGLTKAGLTDAKTRVEAMTATWAEATTAFSTGQLSAAVSKADSVKVAVSEVMTTLGMPPQQR